MAAETTKSWPRWGRSEEPPGWVPPLTSCPGVICSDIIRDNVILLRDSQSPWTRKGGRMTNVLPALDPRQMEAMEGIQYMMMESKRKAFKVNCNLLFRATPRFLSGHAYRGKNTEIRRGRFVVVGLTADRCYHGVGHRWQMRLQKLQTCHFMELKMPAAPRERHHYHSFVKYRLRRLRFLSEHRSCRRLKLVIVSREALAEESCLQKQHFIKTREIKLRLINWWDHLGSHRWGHYFMRANAYPLGNQGCLKLRVNYVTKIWEHLEG